MEQRDLAQRLAEGRMAMPEALRLAMSLADALRKLHEQGHTHGTLTPFCVKLVGSGLELHPGRNAPDLVTPYSAPEALRGEPADARSDIFAFGSILYEMVTGHWPFEAKTPEALAAAIINNPVPSTGNPSLDGVLSQCLAKDPELRWQRMRRVQMELRLLTVSLRRHEGPPHRGDLSGLVRAEVKQAVEACLAARLEPQERAVAELQKAVAASLQGVQAQLCTLEAKLAAAQEQAERAEAGTAEGNLRISGLEQRVSAPAERVGRAELLVQAAAERLTKVEQSAETMRRRVDAVAEEVSVRLHSLGQSLGAQNDSLDSARRAMAQTDDLVERVVEALDSLQSIVLERAEEKSPSVS